MHELVSFTGQVNVTYNQGAPIKVRLNNQFQMVMYIIKNGVHVISCLVEAGDTFTVVDPFKGVSGFGFCLVQRANSAVIAPAIIIIMKGTEVQRAWQQISSLLVEA